MTLRPLRRTAGTVLSTLSPRTYAYLKSRRLRRDHYSYSQEGEDLLLARYFGAAPHGYYVDVGAYDPIRFSNTYLFYRRGWRGVNIDALPGSMKLFKRLRRGDVNLETAVGTANTRLPLYVFNEPALNSFDKALSQQRQSDRYRIVKTIDVPVKPLSEVLRGHLPSQECPSFLTVDVEGHDLDVLQSNDWYAFHPTFVLVECLDLSLDHLLVSPITRFMKGLDYQLLVKTLNTAFYRRLGSSP